MKILHTSAFSDDKGGGTSRVATELTHAFVKKGYSIALLRAGKKYRNFIDEFCLNIFEYKTIQDGQIFLSSLSPIEINKIFSILDNYKPDIIHAHDLDPVATIVLVWALINKIPFFHTTHILPNKSLEFGLGEALPKHLKNFVQPNAKMYFAELIKNCSCIIALTKDSIKDLRSVGYKGAIEVIPNGRNLEDYTKCKFTNILNKDKTLIFIGFISERKNQKYLLQVLKYLPKNYKLVLAGDFFNENEKNKFLKNIDKEVLKRVTFLGQIEHNKVSDELEKSQLFVSATKLETIGLVYIESLASGTPIVALENYGSKLLVNDKVGKLLPINTPPKVFANEVRKILTLSKSDYEKMCLEARKSVSHLHWDNIVDKTADVYKKYLIGQKDHYVTPEMINKISFLLPSKSVQFLQRIVKNFYKNKKTYLVESVKLPKLTLFLFIFLIIISGGVFLIFLLKNFQKKGLNLNLKHIISKANDLLSKDRDN